MSTGNQPGKIACPHCQGLLKTPALAAGALVSCPKCGEKFRLGESLPEVQGPKSKVQSQESGVRGQGPAGRRSAAVPPPVPSTPAAAPAPPPPDALQSPNPKSKIQNPKSRSPDTIDPNLLPPPPPIAKPKPTQVAVVCHLCGTRTYAPLDKAGQSIKCPDCHTVNVVPALKTEAPKKSTGPTLEGTEEYGMSEVVDRPKYRPLQATRGEYEVLSALDPASVEHRLSVPGEQPRAAAATKEAPPRSENEEVVLAPPVERVEVKHVPVNYVEIDPAEEMYDGRYDDGAIGDGVDPRSPDAWKQAPFVYGIVDFLGYPTTMLRWFVFAAGLAGVGTLVKMNIDYAMSDQPQAQILSLSLMRIAIPAGAVWLIAFSAAALAIVQGTANGEKEVTSWPDWSPYEWYNNALYIMLAGIAAGFPGGIISAATLAASTDDPMMAAFGIVAPLVLSLLVLFPFVLYSMLAEDSFMAVFSTHTTNSLQTASDGWVFFYMYSIVIYFFGGALAAVMFRDNFFLRLVAACGVVALMFLYFRLLGRLMWYCSEKALRLENQRARQVAASR
jgi:DNA-directed RNA polymerase subunit M/transcription elongation factor TFIIS